MNPSTTLRQRMRQQRLTLSDRQRRALSNAMSRRLLHSRLFRGNKHIACYLAMAGEMDPNPLIREIWKRRKRCYLPILDAPYAHHMMFAPYRRHSAMDLNRFHIAEPQVGKRDKRKGRQLDLVLVPLVAFDSNGNRLGMGGGFYDRTFAFINRHHRWHKPKLVGLAYEFQHVEQLDAQPWDVKLDAAVTEKQVYIFTNNLTTP